MKNYFKISDLWLMGTKSDNGIKYEFCIYNQVDETVNILSSKQKYYVDIRSYIHPDGVGCVDQDGKLIRRKLLRCEDYMDEFYYLTLDEIVHFENKINDFKENFQLPEGLHF